MAPKKVQGSTNSSVKGSLKQQHNKKSSLRKNAKKVNNLEEKSVLEKEVKEESKTETWLDHLPPVIKPDAELHISLSRERKEKRRNKITEYCMKELWAMVAFMFDQINTMDEFKENSDCDEQKLEKALRRQRIAYEKGEYFPTDATKENYEVFIREGEVVSGTFGVIRTPNVRELFKNDNMGDREEIFELMKKVCGDSTFDYDMNQHVDSLLKTLYEKMQAYDNPDPPPEPASFPFLACVSGPPGSGKSTVCDFLRRHFRVCVINIYAEEVEFGSYDNVINIIQPDDKLIISDIISRINDIPEDYGVVISNFPNSKSQFIQLDKSLQQFKNKAKSHLASISMLFKLNMTQQEAEMALQGRKISRRTGIVYNETFNPPNVLDLKGDPEFFTVNTDTSSYQKHVSLLAQLESINKKGFSLSNIGYCDNVDDVYLVIENLIRQSFDFRQIQPSFTSFVGICDRRKLEFSKQCYDIWTVWNDHCTPLYSRNLVDLHIKIRSIQEKIEYLSKISLERYALILSHPDDRPDIERETRQTCSFYDHIWNESCDIRDQRLMDVDFVISRSGIEDLCMLLERDQDKIFDSLISRLYLVSWFMSQFNEATLEERILESIPIPTIPCFDTQDLSSVAKILGIDEGNEIPDSIRSLRSFSDILMPQLDVTFPEDEEIRERKPKRANTQLACVPDALDVPEKAKQERSRTFNTQIKFCKSIYEEYKERRSSVDESIRNFLKFTLESMNVKTLKSDSKLVLEIFNYLVESKTKIVSRLFFILDSLKDKMTEWTQKKYHLEMETFSHRYKQLNCLQPNEPVFLYGKSFAEDDYQTLVDRLGFREIVPFSLARVYSLAEGLSGPMTTTLSNILSVAEGVGFTYNELLSLEILIRLSSVPDNVNVYTLFYDIVPVDHYNEIKTILGCHT